MFGRYTPFVAAYHQTFQNYKKVDRVREIGLGERLSQITIFTNVLSVDALNPHFVMLEEDTTDKLPTFA